MAKKPLGLDRQGIQKTMRPLNYLGDGLGQIALNVMTGLLGILVYFYTDKAGIAAGTAGTVMLATKVIDAFSDLGMGWLVDRVRTRFGKARHWLLWGAVPAGIAVATLFMVPAGASEGTKFAYALTTNVLLSAVVYTMIVIPYGALMFYLSPSSEERGRMGLLRAIFGYLGGMIIAMGYIPITNALGGDQPAWIIFGIGCGVVTTVCILIAFLADKERTDEGQEVVEDRLPLGKSISLLFTNKYWVIMLGVTFVSAMIFAITSASGIYYVKWIIGDESLIAILAAIGLVPVIIGFASVAPLARFFGMAGASRMALLVGIVATIVRCVFPYDLWALMFVGPFVTIATIPLMALIGPLVQNTVTYGEWKHGHVQVGMANAASSFGQKIGNGLGAAIIGWILAFGGYDGTAPEQSESALNAIIGVSIWLPGVLLILCWLLLRAYDLEAKYADIVKDLEERKSSKVL